jgi:hypothetical protein
MGMNDGHDVNLFNSVLIQELKRPTIQKSNVLVAEFEQGMSKAVGESSFQSLANACIGFSMQPRSCHAQDRAVDRCVRSFLDICIKVAIERRGLVGSALALASDRVRLTCCLSTGRFNSVTR